MQIQLGPEDIHAIDLYIRQYGFGIKTPPLTSALPADVFRQHYYDKKELIKFCRSSNIPTGGLKNELNDRIDLFLRTGQVNQVKFSKNKGKPDSEIGLSLDTVVVNYKSDPVTRAFFQKHLPEFTGFSAYVQKWVKERLAHGECLTYGEVIEKHKTYLLEKSQAKSRGAATVVAHNSCQYNQFYIDYAHDPAPKIHSAAEAWQLVRDIAGDKTYEGYKKRVDEIRKLIAA